MSKKLGIKIDELVVLYNQGHTPAQIAEKYGCCTSNITRRLKKELKVPFLFLSSGPYCRMHRIMGPYLGSCMWLCVDEYATFSSREQPLLSATADVIRKLDFMPTIRPLD